jgi:protein SCO1/2
MMTQKMSTLQSSIPDSRVQLVTFTVDPERDTPAVLKQYAKEHDADESRWHFLTGDKDAIFALARGMLLTALPAQADTPIMHSEKFVLVDGAGKIRKYYDSKDPADLARLTADAARLAAQAKSTPVASRPVEPAR